MSVRRDVVLGCLLALAGMAFARSAELLSVPASQLSKKACSQRATGGSC